MVRKLLLCLLIVYWLVLVALTHSPKLPTGGPRIGDKTAHFLAYGLLTGLLFLTLWAFRPRLRLLPLVVLAIPLAYGAVDELTQPLSGRDCEFADWVADALGAAIAVVVLTIIRHFAPRPRREKMLDQTPSLDVSP